MFLYIQQILVTINKLLKTSKILKTLCFKKYYGIGHLGFRIYISDIVILLKTKYYKYGNLENLLKQIE